MRFSGRTEWETGENAWAESLREARERGRPLLDLTRSNPAQCGLGPGASEVLPPLADPGALRYQPYALGMPEAREAVARYYRDRGAEVAIDRICLTASTSEAYRYVFRLLCDPGDEVLIARPSYPLFDLLAQVEDVALRAFPLVYEPGGVAARGEAAGRWRIDLAGLAAAITPRTRAVVVVHPNNPTGSFVSPEERAALCGMCAERGLALVADEVFLDFGLDEPSCRAGSFLAASSGDPLCFVLSGISKVFALPQMKLAWIAVAGPQNLVTAAMHRLEIVADTYLSVGAPAQYALPSWLDSCEPVQAAIRARLRENRMSLEQMLRGSLGNALAIEGGWTAVVRVPAHVDDAPFALAAMAAGVVVQPGPFYGLSAGHCVISLLTPPEVWRQGLRQLPLFFRGE